MAGDPIAEHEALFRREGDVLVATPLARGPWNPNALHGGATSALLMWACEAHDPQTAPLLTRLTVELLRPVPLGALTLHVETIRPGHKVQWVAARLAAADDGTPVAQATALRMRTTEVDVEGAAVGTAEPPPPRHDTPLPLMPFGEGAIGYWSANDVILVRGNWLEAGPGTAWLRLKCPVVAGEPITPAMRVAAAADFGSGVGSAVRVTSANAINAELTVHLHRHPEPAREWICLESSSWVEPTGVGMAETRLHDEDGPIGRAVQSLLVEPASRLRFGG
jgi:acyl-coenzyme A thioesterase PaaI-like protein